MPAARSRTGNWTLSLRKILDRGGSLEISLARPPSDEAGPDQTDASAAPVSDLIWRVRLLSIEDGKAIIVETPMTMGRSIGIVGGAELIAGMTIGQNRWMFQTSVVSLARYRVSDRRETAALRLAWPDRVERCRRRSFNRIATHELKLPLVTCWPLLDPVSAAVAEKANQVQILSLLEGRNESNSRVIEQLALPEVGPPFEATLANLGGGGIGLVIPPCNLGALRHHRLYWIRISLPPEIPVPLAVTAKLVHTHMDSSHNTYAGMAFEFSHHKGHQEFVVEQLCRYVDLQQRAQQSLMTETVLRRRAS